MDTHIVTQLSRVYLSGCLYVDLFAVDNRLLVDTITENQPKRRHRFFVCVDSGVADAWPALNTEIRRYTRTFNDAIELVAEPLVIPGGEACKNDPELVHQVLTQFARHGLDRQSYILAIGGGAVLDMVGYAATIAHRGIRSFESPRRSSLKMMPELAQNGSTH